MCGAIDTLKPRQNDRHVANDLDRLIFNSTSYLFMAWQISIFPWRNANIWFNRLLLNLDCEGAFVSSNEIVSHRHHNYKNKDQFIIGVCITTDWVYLTKYITGFADLRSIPASQRARDPVLLETENMHGEPILVEMRFFFFFFFWGGGGYLTKISCKGRGMAHCTMCCSDLNLMYQS